VLKNANTGSPSVDKIPSTRTPSQYFRIVDVQVPRVLVARLLDQLALELVVGDPRQDEGDSHDREPGSQSTCL
jgi:hypothetical protein